MIFKRVILVLTIFTVISCNQNVNNTSSRNAIYWESAEALNYYTNVAPFGNAEVRFNIKCKFDRDTIIFDEKFQLVNKTDTISLKRQFGPPSKHKIAANKETEFIVRYDLLKMKNLLIGFEEYLKNGKLYYMGRMVNKSDDFQLIMENGSVN